MLQTIFFRFYPGKRGFPEFIEFKKIYFLNITVEITFLSRDRPVAVSSPSPFFQTPSPLSPSCVFRVQRSFSVPKRPLIYDD
jgi:hypothetical protein